MNRHQRRQLAAEQHTHKRKLKLPKELTRLDPAQMPSFAGAEVRPFEMWVSEKYMAQLYREPNNMIRLSVCSTTLSNDGFGRWEDRIPWDVLQDIKARVGFGEYYAVEVYPPDAWVVNMANFRHLWILPLPLPIGWMPKATEDTSP